MTDSSVRLEMNDATNSEIKVSGRWHAVIVTLPVDVMEAIREYKTAIDELDAPGA